MGRLGGDASGADGAEEVAHRSHKVVQRRAHHLTGCLVVLANHLAAGLDHHRLQILGPHHRADPGAGGEPPVIITDPRHVGELLPALPDHGDRRLLAVLLLELLLNGDRIGAPVLRGVFDAHRIVINENVDRLVRLTVDQDPVPTRELQVGAEIAAAVGVAPATRRGTLAHGLEAVAEDRRPRHEAGDQAEHVIRAQRIGALGNPIEEQAHADPVPAKEVAIHLLRQLLRSDLPRAQMDVQDLAVVCALFGHGAPFPRD